MKWGAKAVPFRLDFNWDKQPYCLSELSFSAQAENEAIASVQKFPFRVLTPIMASPKCWRGSGALPVPEPLVQTRSEGRTGVD